MLSIFLRKIQVCYLCIMNQQMTLLDVMVEHFLPKLVEHFCRFGRTLCQNMSKTTIF